LKSKKKDASLKKRIFEIIQIGNKSDFISLLFDIFIVAVILLNILITFVLTFDEFSPYKRFLETLEFITIVIFTLEYILRIWTAKYLYPDKKPQKAVLAFLFSFYGIVDLLTILPYFLPFVFPSGIVAFRMFRVVRILHLFKINSNYDAFNVITDVLKEKKNQLVSSIFLILILMLASSLCMYSLEHEAQPENFSNAFSGIWWSMSTLLTVGYGDIYPITTLGKLMAIFIAFLGVGVVAIPTGIISAGFVEYYTKIKVGTLETRDASLISLAMPKGHPYIGKTIRDIELPRGLYPAVLIKGSDVLIPYPTVEIGENDCLLLGSEGNIATDCRLEEIALKKGHPWIGLRIKELDISRRCFIIMIQRKGQNIRPQSDFLLQENDVVMILEKKFFPKK